MPNHTVAFSPRREAIFQAEAGRLGISVDEVIDRALRRRGRHLERDLKTHATRNLTYAELQAKLDAEAAIE